MPEKTVLAWDSQDFTKKALRTEFVTQKGSDSSAKRYRSPHLGQV
jgi:hypothetical protein